MDLDLFMSYVLCDEAACDTKELNFASQKVTSRYKKLSSDYQESKIVLVIVQRFSPFCISCFYT